jgi:hypothetical protein
MRLGVIKEKSAEHYSVTRANGYKPHCYMLKSCHVVPVAYYAFHSAEMHESYYKVRGPFAKFVDSPYYSESEPRGGAVTVTFSKYFL